ncbi:MAG: sigma-70 family RNA polymerase sigma factor [Planctomycetota bacterium]
MSIARHMPPADPTPPTSLFARRALHGDRDGLSVLMARLRPLLLAQIRYRLGPSLLRQHDPEDVLHDAWLVAIPRLGDLEDEGRRATPTVLSFLGTTILHVVRNLARAAARQPTTATAEPAALATGVVTACVRRERDQRVQQAIAALTEPDRAALVLRGIEQQPLPAVARLLGISTEAAGKRYRRALVRLRRSLPRELVAELTAAATHRTPPSVVS